MFELRRGYYYIYRSSKVAPIVSGEKSMVFIAGYQAILPKPRTGADAMLKSGCNQGHRLHDSSAVPTLWCPAVLRRALLLLIRSPLLPMRSNVFFELRQFRLLFLNPCTPLLYRMLPPLSNPILIPAHPPRHLPRSGPCMPRRSAHATKTKPSQSNRQALRRW